MVKTLFTLIIQNFRCHFELLMLLNCRIIQQILILLTKAHFYVAVLKLLKHRPEE